MVHHLFNLLAESVASMPGRIGSNWGGAVFSVVLFVITEVLLWLFGDMKEHLKRNTLIGLAVVGVGWTVLFPISTVLTVYEDHQNLVGAARRFRVTAEQEQKLSADQIRQLQRDCAVKEGILQTLEKQNRDEQVLITGCQSEAIKRLTPDPLEITPIILHYPQEDAPKERYTDYLVLTNKKIAPVRLNVHCTQDVSRVAGMYMSPPGSMEIGGGQQINAREYEVRLETGAWTPKMPLNVQVAWANQIGVCAFTER